MTKILRPFIALAACVLLVSGGAAQAATSSASLQGNGYKIAPVRTDLTISPGSTQSITVYLQNVSSAAENLDVFVNDFQARNDETGSPALLLNGQNAPQHGLRQYATLTPNTFALPPGQQRAITVKIAIPAHAAGGGYYGAVRVAPAGANASKNVNLAASVASLILVKVPGNITEQLSVAGLQAESANGSPHSFFTGGKGLKAAVRIQNGGNIQEEPFGKIQLKKGNKVLGSYEVNNTDPRGNVLPGSIRKFTVDLKGVGSFGKYSLIASLGYGSGGQLLSAKSSFYVVPVKLVVLVLAVLLAIILLIFVTPKALRRYNQRVLRKAGRQ